MRARRTQKVRGELHDGPEGGEQKQDRRAKGGRKSHRILLGILMLLVTVKGTKMGMQYKSFFPKIYEKTKVLVRSSFGARRKVTSMKKHKTENWTKMFLNIGKASKDVKNMAMKVFVKKDKS